MRGVVRFGVGFGFGVGEIQISAGVGAHCNGVERERGERGAGVEKFENGVSVLPISRVMD